MKRRITSWMLMAAGATSVVGCAGARGDIVASEAQYPVSMSASIPDAEGRVYVLGEDLEQVGKLEDTFTRIGFVYGATADDIDLSEAINEQVRAAGGEGIAMLTIGADQCALNWVFPLTLLPFWPGCQNVGVSGIIVRRKDTAPAKGASR